MAELAVGRHQGLSPIGSIKQLAKDSNSSPRWAFAGWVGTLAALTVLTIYSVVAGKVLAFSLMTFSGEFVGADPGTASASLSMYANDTHKIIWHTLFMGITVFVVSRGLHSGIERVVTILMPIFFVMLAGLCIYALVIGDAGKAVSFLFSPDFSKLTPLTVLAAMGQAFFSVGVGAAIMITYGSFLSKEENIGNSAAMIAGADTFVAVIAGLMIFPIIFSFGLDPATDQISFSTRCQLSSRRCPVD